MKRCLIVDDDMTTRFIVETILDEYFVCEMADSGEAALEAFDMAHQREAHYHLICLDITMPGMNGLKVLQHIRETEQALFLPPEYESKVIIISADRTPATILDSFFARGASAYVSKPIDRDKLIHELEMLMLVSSG